MFKFRKINLLLAFKVKIQLLTVIQFLVQKIKRCHKITEGLKGICNIRSRKKRRIKNRLLPIHLKVSADPVTVEAIRMYFKRAFSSQNIGGRANCQGHAGTHINVTILLIIKIQTVCQEHTVLPQTDVSSGGRCIQNRFRIQGTATVQKEKLSRLFLKIVGKGPICNKIAR